MNETVQNWKANRPTGAEKHDRLPPIVFAAVAIFGLAVAICCSGCVATVSAQMVTKPADDWIVFGTATMPQVGIADRDLKARGVPFRIVFLGRDPDPPEWSEFLSAVPQTSRTARTGFVGPATARPSSTPLPVVWRRGSDRYWMGWSTTRADDCVDWIQQQTQRLSQQAGERSNALRGLLAAPLADPGDDDVFLGDGVHFDEGVPEDFDGLILIVTVASLTEGNEDLRAAAAFRAGKALEDLARTSIGQRVRVYLVAQVAEPDTFDQLCALTGRTPGGPSAGPVGVQVLIPRRIEGMRGLIASRVETALQEHYQEDIRNAGVSLVFERLHPETFAALRDLVEDPERSRRRDEAPPFDLMQCMLAALATERLGLARRLLSRFGYAA